MLIVLSVKILIKERERLTKPKTKEVKQKMVNINEIPQEEKPRVDITKLPKKNILRATKEYTVEATDDKTGGLIIVFDQKDGKEVIQKYGKISGYKLAEALTKLNLKDTMQLQESFYEYVLTDMRSGYPRYLPVKKVEG